MQGILQKLAMNWSKNLKGNIVLSHPLARLTSFKIGGNAQYFARPHDVEELRGLLLEAKQRKIPVHILGAGTNLLIRDSVVKGLVIRLDAAAFKKVTVQGSDIEAGAGVYLAGLVREAVSHSLSGFECLAGIPGTLGGSLVMNAGAWGGAVADMLVDVTVVDPRGYVTTIPKKGLRFGYRSSSLSRYIVISARFALTRNNTRSIETHVRKNLELKREQQDLSKPSAGCIFKNPSGQSAGKLIDQCGFKGRRVGGAVVSTKHANYILNDRNASAQDVITLMGLVRRKVRARFGVILKPEIKIWK